MNAKATAEPKRKHASKSRNTAQARRRKIVKAQIEGRCLRDAGIEAGLSPASADSQVCHIINHPQSKALFAEYLEKAGLSDEILAEKIEKLTNADQTLFFQHQGRVTDERIVPALETRRKSLELCARLKGHLQETKVSPDITINIMGAVVNALKADQD
jgi:hypothetical protein